MKQYKDKKQFRYKGYDYSKNGFYFVTICARNRGMFFGDVATGTQDVATGTQDVATGTQDVATGTQDVAFLRAAEIGKIAEKCWREIPVHFSFVKLDEFVVMPNHIHGIIQIDNNVGTQDFAFPRDFAFPQEYKNEFGPQSGNLSSIIRGFKIGVTKYANENNLDFAWQSRFHDRIIRNEDELNKIRQYIVNNPQRWELDKNNSENLFM